MSSEILNLIDLAVTEDSICNWGVVGILSNTSPHCLAIRISLPPSGKYYIVSCNYLSFIKIYSLLKKVHAAMRSSTAMREFTTDFRGTGKSIPKLSSSAARATDLRTSEKAKWLRPLTACRRFGVFSTRLA